ncbi:MAG: TlpA family protein disulfide reductase [Saprospirales bacterium]|nr:TlpA family protein disulfide reductase [Saprospirales bacterium]MBK8493068.1 TlpA family protein disulfide reductase [Saprospirales bacterium]
MNLPDWHIETTDGSPAPELAQYRGKNLLILFYSMGCPGCLSRAIPLTLQLQRVYPDLQLVAIHTHYERSRQTPEEIRIAADQMGVGYPVFLDKGIETAGLFQAEGTPHWILAGKDGELLKSIFGSMPNALQRLDLSLTELYQEVL